MMPHLKAIARHGVFLVAALLLPPLCLNEGLSWRYEAAVAQAPAPSETEAFNAAKDLGTVEAWDAFLSNYPTGFHADLARAYLKKLASPATTSTAAPTPPTEAPPAHERPCRDASKLKSEKSNSPAKIRFINESGSVIVIQWIDFKGALKEYGELQPGAEMIQETFITHPWVAAYREGGCRQLFLPRDGTSTARLLSDAQLKAEREDEPGDHGPTPEQTCKDSGMDYDGAKCVARKTKKKATQPSKATIERRAKASCADIGMIYLNGKCAPKTKPARDNAAKNKNKACPAGMYRNPYGQCQPNETGG